jgi:hypothetical protein
MEHQEADKPQLPPFERLADIAKKLEDQIVEADWSGDEAKRAHLMARLASVRWHMGYGEEYAVPF